MGWVDCEGAGEASKQGISIHGGLRVDESTAAFTPGVSRSPTGSEFEPCCLLVPCKFADSNKQSKTIWMKAMQSRPKFRNVRARATLRNQLEREPTAAELKHALESNDHSFPIEEEVILREFNEGREVRISL